MNTQSNAAYQAVQESVVNLLDLVTKAARNRSSQEMEALHDETHKVVLMFIAAIVLSDGKYEPGEQAFIQLLVNWREKPGGDVRYLNEYAELWKTASLQVPTFFNYAVQHDILFKTDLAPAIMRELQLIGNNAGVSDGNFAATEKEAITHYLNFLEQFRVALIAQAQQDIRPLAGWNAV